MTIQELIDKLSTVKNKQHEIIFFAEASTDPEDCRTLGFKKLTIQKEQNTLYIVLQEY